MDKYESEYDKYLREKEQFEAECDKKMNHLQEKIQEVFDESDREWEAERKRQEALRKAKNRKRLDIVLSLLLLLCLIAVPVFWFGDQNDQMLTLDENVEQQVQIPVLGTDRTQFYVGEREEATLCVYLSREIENGTIDILDKEKNKVTSISVEDMDTYDSQYQYKEIDIIIYEETDMLKSYTAVYECYESTPLNLYITPHITKENVELCGEILEDLHDYLSENKIKEDKLLEIACEWLNADKRVSAAGIQQGMVLFSTVDCVMGSFSIKTEGTFGAAYEEDEVLLEQYQNLYNTQERKHIYDIDTITNSKVLVLRPLYGVDDDCTVEYHAEYGKKIAETLRDESDICTNCKVNEDCEQCRRCDVIEDNWCYKYLGGLTIQSMNENDMTDYGFVFYNTHGTVMEKKSGGMQALYQVGKYETMELALEDMEKIVQVDYENENTEDVYTDFYDKFYGLYGESESYRMIYGKDNGKPAIYHTSNLIMDYYSNKFFDNTIFYFGICSTFQDEVLNQFLLNHGAQCIIGYPMKVGLLAEKLHCQKVFDTFLSDSKQEKYRSYNLIEAEEKKSGVGMLLLFKIEGVLEKIESKWFEVNQGLPYYVGNEDYFFKGTTTLYGTVKVENPDGTKIPCTDALISAYRLDAGEFKVACENIPTKENGEFALEDIRCGVYVIKVTDKNGKETLKTMRFDEENQNGGEIVLKEEVPDYYQYIYEQLLPKYGYANMETMKETATFDDYANFDKETSKRYWDDRVGLVSADITDLNTDGVLDLVVQYFAEESKEINQSNMDAVCLYAELYSINKNNEIYLVGRRKIGSSISIERYHLMSGIVEIDGKPYLFVESKDYGCFVDYGGNFYRLLEFGNNGKWNLKYSIGQSAGGTSEVAYSLWEYENGELVKETVLWADSSYRAFFPETIIATEKTTSFSEAIAYGLSMLGMNVPIEDLSFMKNLEVKQSLIYDISEKGKYDRMSFTSELTDKTDLKEKLKQYEVEN